MVNTPRAVMQAVQQKLAEAGLDSVQFESRILLETVLELPYGASLPQQPLTEAQQQRLAELTARRCAHEPLQYLCGTWEFFGLEFQVGEGVLIPRQDTETLCEEAIALIKRRGYKTCLDLCAGSGCIGISIANICGTEVTLADISEAALSLCRENAEANGVSIRTIKTDMIDEITDKYDIIVCNPPYLTASDMASLQRELTFEPANALYGGVDGLDFYRRIARDYAQRLNDGGALALEVGIYQAEEVAKMLGGARMVKDVCGIERAVIKEW